MNAHIGSIT